MNRRLLGLLALFVLALAPALPAQGAKAGRSGIGLQVVALPGGDLVVVRVVPASPAERAGMRPGDLLVGINGRSLAGSQLATLSHEALWGKEGTSVRVRFLRPGEAGAKELTVVREELGVVPAAPAGVEMLQPQQGQEEEGKRK